MRSRTLNSLARLAVCAMLFAPVLASAAEGPRLQTAPINSHDIASLQNGAKLFVNYCLNCHSAGYMRYNRLRDLGLTEQQITDNLIFTGVKVGELMQTSMDKKDAKEWFGVAPPDLTVTARSRSSAAGSGADWIYTYLRAFYRDSSRPTGWNNLVFANVGMPHALWQLNGQQQLEEQVFDSEHAATAALIAAKTVSDLEEAREVKDGKAVTRYVVKSIKPATGTAAGTLSQVEYENAVADLVNYMNYMAEPSRLERRQIGIYTLLVLGLLFVFVFALKRAYWKDVH
ncbi:MAG TPA: cytochrome c1 [Candidatus Binatia bacterium]|jgi:ubiquinol-cytochrome c reductase cytochrome c1 subunit|nr:cytochrome c1 [Candidatus Binatia bacterium]